MRTSTYDCTIIGSGIGGLCAGAILARRGLKVCVLEKHHQAGGYAQIVGQAGFDRFRNKSPINNLVFSSAWTFPGGGFEGAMRAGYKAANLVKR